MNEGVAVGHARALQLGDTTTDQRVRDELASAVMAAVAGMVALDDGRVE